MLCCLRRWLVLALLRKAFLGGPRPRGPRRRAGLSRLGDRVGSGLRPARDTIDATGEARPPSRLQCRGGGDIGTDVRSRRRSNHTVTARQLIAPSVSVASRLALRGVDIRDGCSRVRRGTENTRASRVFGATTLQPGRPARSWPVTKALRSKANPAPQALLSSRDRIGQQSAPSPTSPALKSPIAHIRPLPARARARRGLEPHTERA